MIDFIIFSILTLFKSESRECETMGKEEIAPIKNIPVQFEQFTFFLTINYLYYNNIFSRGIKVCLYKLN